jgi:hypothetical protein
MKCCEYGPRCTTFVHLFSGVFYDKRSFKNVLGPMLLNFFVRNLRVIIKSCSVCSWQTLPFLSTKHSSFVRKLVNYGQKSFYNIGPCSIQIDWSIQIFLFPILFLITLMLIQASLFCVSFMLHVTFKSSMRWMLLCRMFWRQSLSVAKWSNNKDVYCFNLSAIFKKKFFFRLSKSFCCKFASFGIIYCYTF